MNWADIIILVIILGFGIRGFRTGFVLSIFRILSFFASIFLAVKYYPVISQKLLGSQVYTSVKAVIFKNLMLQQQTAAASAASQAKEAAAQAVVTNLKLPGFLKNVVWEKMPDPSQLLDMSQIIDALSGEIAKVVMDILSLVIVYTVIWLGLNLLKFIIAGIAKLPVFRQLDKVGGFSFGALEGMLTVYILLAIMAVFATSPSFKPVYQAIDASDLARFFYQNNFIVGWMLY